MVWGLVDACISLSVSVFVLSLIYRNVHMPMDDWMILSDGASIDAFADLITSFTRPVTNKTPPRPDEDWNRGGGPTGTKYVVGYTDKQNNLLDVVDHVWTHRDTLTYQSSFPNAATRYVLDISSEGRQDGICDECSPNDVKQKGTKLLNDHGIVINAIWLRDRGYFGEPGLEGGRSFQTNSLDYGTR